MSLPESHPAAGSPHDCGTFLLDISGAFRPEDIIVRWSETPRPTTAEVDDTIAETWQREMEKARRTGRRLFDGKLCRLVNWDSNDGRLSILLGPVGFREFLGTNATHAHLRYFHGPEVLADPLGVSAALVTTDGFLMLGRRSGQVMQYAGRIHPVGGVMEPSADGTTPPSPARTMLDELREETALPARSIGKMTCLGIVRDKHTVQPEMLFDVAATLDSAAVVRGAEEAVDADEHAELVPVRDHPAAVVSFIERHGFELTPICQAVLLLHGQRHWGSGWFSGARGYLRGVI